MTATDTFTFEEIVADLDLEEPCEVNPKCDKSAEWIATMDPSCDCAPRKALCCTKHKDTLLELRATAILLHGGLRCTRCLSPCKLVSIDPLNKKG